MSDFDCKNCKYKEFIGYSRITGEGIIRCKASSNRQLLYESGTIVRYFIDSTNKNRFECKKTLLDNLKKL